eukprot:jgi/Ulvmu1/10689/UM067_0015.1
MFTGELEARWRDFWTSLQCGIDQGITWLGLCRLLFCKRLRVWDTSPETRMIESTPSWARSITIHKGPLRLRSGRDSFGDFHMQPSLLRLCPVGGLVEHTSLNVSQLEALAFRL